MIVTLRIKKVYFDAIANGEKTVEYRSVKPFYRNLADPSLTHVMLHYQKAPRLLCDVVKVRKIKCPKFLRESGIDFTDRVYAIHLANPRRLTRKASR